VAARERPQINDAGLVCGGVHTANATVYMIDTVLVPPASSGSRSVVKIRQSRSPRGCPLAFRHPTNPKRRMPDDDPCPTQTDHGKSHHVIIRAVFRIGGVPGNAIGSPGDRTALSSRRSANRYWLGGTGTVSIMYTVALAVCTPPHTKPAVVDLRSFPGRPRSPRRPAASCAYRRPWPGSPALPPQWKVRNALQLVVFVFGIVERGRRNLSNAAIGRRETPCTGRC